jgi:nitroreductase
MNNSMSVDDAIRSRRSVRGFLPKEVPQAELDHVFTLAQWAPSNCNVQLWVPHVVSGPALQRLGQALVQAAANDLPLAPDWPADGKYHGVYRDRQFDAAAQLYGAMGVKRKDMAARKVAYLRNQACFDAPHAVFMFMQKPFDARESTDLGIYAQTLMLALTARGIASCAQGALALYPPIVREHLGVSDDYRLMFGISFGYEDPRVPANSARVGRASLEEAVVFHRD